jgi:hypothetical protein
MNTPRRLALALVLVGGLTMAVSSHGYVSSSAERGVTLQTVSDENAYVGLEFPEANPSGVIELESGDETFGGCNPWFCLDYWYLDVQIVLLTDQLPSQQLDVDGVEIQTSGDDIHIGFTNTTDPTTPSNAIHRVDGSFVCDESGGDQQPASETVSLSFDISNANDNFTVTVTRDVVVECVAD